MIMQHRCQNRVRFVSNTTYIKSSDCIGTFYYMVKNGVAIMVIRQNVILSDKMKMIAHGNVSFASY